MNEVELELLSGVEDLDEGSKRLIELGPEAVVATLGPGGSYFRTAGKHGHVPGFQVKTIDATGCGDAFIAGVLSQLIDIERMGAGWKETDWGSILRFANGVGALTAKTMGVIPALPSSQEVSDFLSSEEEREHNNE